MRATWIPKLRSHDPCVTCNMGACVFLLRSPSTRETKLHAVFFYLLEESLSLEKNSETYLIKHGELVGRRVCFGCHVQVLNPLAALLLLNRRQFVEVGCK